METVVQVPCELVVAQPKQIKERPSEIRCCWASEGLAVCDALEQEAAQVSSGQGVADLPFLEALDGLLGDQERHQRAQSSS